MQSGMDRAIKVRGALVVMTLSYATMADITVSYNPLITMQPMKYYIRDPDSFLQSIKFLPPRTTNLQRMSLCPKRTNIFRLLCTIINNFPTSLIHPCFYLADDNLRVIL